MKSAHKMEQWMGRGHTLNQVKLCLLPSSYDLDVGIKYSCCLNCFRLHVAIMSSHIEYPCRFIGTAQSAIRTILRGPTRSPQKYFCSEGAFPCCNTLPDVTKSSIRKCGFEYGARDVKIIMGFKL